QHPRSLRRGLATPRFARSEAKNYARTSSYCARSADGARSRRRPHRLDARELTPLARAVRQTVVVLARSRLRDRHRRASSGSPTVERCRASALAAAASGRVVSVRRIRGHFTMVLSGEKEVFCSKTMQECELLRSATPRNADVRDVQRE